LEQKDLNGVPILLLSNKIDIKPHLEASDIISGMNLDYIYDNPWNIIAISAKDGTNLGHVIDWLMKVNKK